MSRVKNVVPLPSEKKNDLNLKLFAMLFYVFVAALLTRSGQPGEDGLFTLMILGVLFNFMVRQRIYRTRYFRDNKVILIILLVIMMVVYPYLVILSWGMAGLFWLLVGRSGREAPYFLKFHMLTALIFNFFLLMPYLILRAVLVMVAQGLALLHLSGAGQVLVQMATMYLPLFVVGLTWGATVWLSISVLMGRTPYLPVVTDNVRSLA